MKYRQSRIRSSILDYLRSTDSHPSAEEVHGVVRRTHPRVSFGTVYRNLNILVEQGEAKRLESSRGRDRFDAQPEFHGHFHCSRCGGVYDMPVAEEVLTAAHRLAQRNGHRIEEHQVEFFGLCAHCITSD